MQGKRKRLADRPEIILDAAAAVLLKGGARALTIDAVAAEAGLSKGGVLHHYASKDALIAALVARELTQLREEIAACAVAIPPGPSQLPKAMVAHVRGHYCADSFRSVPSTIAALSDPLYVSRSLLFTHSNTSCPSSFSCCFPLQEAIAKLH